jgi:hypothetical protein
VEAVTAASVLVAGGLIYASVRAGLAHLRWMEEREAPRVADARADELKKQVEACERRLLKLEAGRMGR